MVNNSRKSGSGSARIQIPKGSTPFPSPTGFVLQIQGDRLAVKQDKILSAAGLMSGAPHVPRYYTDLLWQKPQARPEDRLFASLPQGLYLRKHSRFKGLSLAGPRLGIVFEERPHSNDGYTTSFLQLFKKFLMPSRLPKLGRTRLGRVL